MSGDKVELRAEPCKLCPGAKFRMFFDKARLVPDITGMITVVDLHGIHAEKPHVRVLYVDPAGSVRSYTIIENLTAIPSK